MPNSDAPERPVVVTEEDYDQDHSPMLVALVVGALSGFVAGVGIGIVIEAVVL